MKDKLMKESAEEIERLNREENSRNKIKEVTSKPSPQKYFFVNMTTRKSPATSNTSNSNFNAYITQWSETSSSEEEYIETRKCRKKIHVEIINEEVK